MKSKKCGLYKFKKSETESFTLLLTDRFQNRLIKITRKSVNKDRNKMKISIQSYSAIIPHYLQRKPAIYFRRDILKCVDVPMLTRSIYVH